MPPPSATGPRPRLTEWLLRVLSKTGALLILVGVAAGTGALMSPTVPEQLPPYDASSLGQVASQTVRLTRDYDIADPEATVRGRETAVAEVLPVYDADSQLLAEVESRVVESFTFARASLPPRPAPGRLSPRAAAKARADALAAAEPLRGELMGRLQTFLEPRDFTVLLEEGFSAQAESAVAELVRGELGQLILEDRALLPADRARGINVRFLPGGANEQVTDLEALRDLPAARAEVERVAEALPGNLSPALRRALGHVAGGALRSNLTYDAGETARRRARARDEVSPVVLHLSRGERILEAGERIAPRHLLILSAIRAQARPADAVRTRFGGGLFAILLIFLAYRLVRPSVGRRPTRRESLFLGVVLLLSLALTQGLLFGAALARQGVVPLPGLLVALGPRLSSVDLFEALPYAMPVAVGTMLVRLLIGAELVSLYAAVSAALFGLLHGGSLTFALYALAGSLVAARRTRQISRRWRLLRVGVFLASTNAGVVMCSALWAGRLLEPQTLAEAGAGVLGGLVFTPLLVALLAPVLEGLFGYLSDARLSELCNLNQPALKELIVRAPGTYHHSILLAGLAESAAVAIGGNPLLARAIGLYHDLGKGKTPLAFSENQKGPRAEVAATRELAELLQRHVQDGLELGRRYKLPRALLEAIQQHHGTRRVGLSAETLVSTEPELRYGGPRPRRRETALVLLADAVEAQGRRLSAKDAPRLVALVSATVAQIAAEGQLDESDLRLGDLPRIVESFSRDLARTLLERGPEPGPPLERPVGASRGLDVN